MLKNKSFLLLTAGQLFSLLGTTIMQFAISLYVLDLTQSLWTFSFITALSIIGRVICLPICGILADRFSKKKLMLLMDFSYFLFALFYLFATSLANPILLIGVLTILLGMVSAFETPVVQSSIPLLCSEKTIPQANSLISSIGILGGIFGPILAGILYQFDQIHLIFIWSGSLFLLAVTCELFLKIPLIARDTIPDSLKEMVVSDFQETIAYLNQQKIIIKICIIALLLNLFLSSFIQVIVPYITRIHLQVTDNQFGIMNMGFAIGSLLGTIIYGVKGKEVRPYSIYVSLLLSIFIFLCLIVPLNILQNHTFAFWFLLGTISLMMALFSFISLQLIVYIQVNTRTDLIGRMMAFVMVLVGAAMPIGQLIYGSLGSLFVTQSNLIVLILIVSSISFLIARYSIKIVIKM